MGGACRYRPDLFAHNEWLLGVLGLNLLGIGAGAVYLWPTEISTWWEKERVREGMGLIIATLSLLAVVYTLWRLRSVDAAHFAG